MKTRKWNFLIIGPLFVAGLILAVSFISGAIAAPGAAPSGTIQAAPMAALAEAPCDPDPVTLIPTCHLWAKAGSLTMPDGSVPVWGFALNDTDPASVPGPVIRANLGETLEIVLHNGIAGETMALAFPGQELIPDLAGVAETFTATYRLTPATAGTFLYEAGLTSGGARQVAMGLFGALVVEDPGVTPTWAQEEILVFSELDPAFNADPAGFNMFHFKPKYWLINGQVWPATGYIPVAADSTVLLRYLNAGVEHRTIGLLGLNQEVVAANGEKLFAPHGAVAEPLMPGQTKETLVTVPLVPDGTLYGLYNASLHQHNNNQRLADGRGAFGGMLTFLQVSGEPPTTAAGPVASNVTVAPSKTDGDVNVIFSATLSDPDLVAAAEYFVDTVGTTGSTIPVVQGASVDVEVTFTPTDLAGWTSGAHTLYIRGQDALGNWGEFGSAVLYLDKAGPAISGLSLNPNPTNGSVDVALSATADDRAHGGSAVASAEYSLDGGVTWTPMALSATGTSVKALSATVLAADVAALGEGAHPVWVQAWDEWDNPSEVPGVIDLVMDQTGPTVPAVTLLPNALDFNQPLPVTTVRLTATVQDALATLANAEGFVDAVGAPGTGFDLYPADGLFDELIEDVYYDIPASHFATLSDGVHSVFVTGLDKAGNWSSTPGSAGITITAAMADNTGPVVSGLLITLERGNRIILSGVATDSQSAIARVDWYLATDPTTTFLMDPADGAFDTLNEGFTSTINVNKWAPGTVIGVVALDAQGNWGEVTEIVYTP